MIEQGAMVLRDHAAEGPGIEAERAHPGITNARVTAYRQAALGRLPALIATLDSEAATFLLHQTDATTRAAFLPYLRSSPVQRSIRWIFTTRRGETVAAAVARNAAAVEAAETAPERRTEQAFLATPAGQHFTDLATRLRTTLDLHKRTLLLEAIRAGVTAADAAATAFPGAHPAAAAGH